MAADTIQQSSLLLANIRRVCDWLNVCNHLDVFCYECTDLFQNLASCLVSISGPEDLGQGRCCVWMWITLPLCIWWWWTLCSGEAGTRVSSSAAHTARTGAAAGADRGRFLLVCCSAEPWPACCLFLKHTHMHTERSTTERFIIVYSAFKSCFLKALCIKALHKGKHNNIEQCTVNTTRDKQQIEN